MSQRFRSAFAAPSGFVAATTPSKPAGRIAVRSTDRVVVGAPGVERDAAAPGGSKLAA